MNSKWTVYIALGIIVVILAIIAATAFLTPDSYPPNAAAINFARAAASGDEPAAVAYLSPDLQAYVAANCPDGTVSGCVADYIPDEWGGYRGLEFRRAMPDGNGYHIDLIGFWEQDRGFSGVCVYLNVQPDGAGGWQVTRWAGWAWCGEPATRDMETNPQAPNRAP
jgi:hypothetical protein